MTNEKPLPLEGLRVADFTWIVAGPQATRVLGDLGAEVIKVENESYMDAVRGAPGLHHNFHRNKLSIAANLHHPKGREAVEKLIASSDIVVENYSTGAFARMGFPYERLKELRKDIIYISLSGYGQVGCDRMYSTWGPTAQGVSGTTAVSGLPAPHPPAGWGYSYLDHTGGYYGAIAALMALWHRDETGEGQHVDMSQVETGMVLNGVHMLDYQVNGRHYERIGNRRRWPAAAPHGIYRTAGEDRWIAIAAENDHDWQAIREVLDLPDDPRFATNDGRVSMQDELDAAIEARTSTMTAEDLSDQLVARNVAAGVCQTIEDRMEHDPQLKARGFYPEAEHLELGVHRVEGLPMQFSRARWEVRRGGPVLGQDTRDVLQNLLGYSEAEIDEMTAEMAIQ